ncbi:MAG: hypothetical protein ACP5NP_15980 [Acetobacteraceae bacterium]
MAREPETDAGRRQLSWQFDKVQEFLQRVLLGDRSVTAAAEHEAMTPDEKLLDHLQALVDEWGFERVAANLRQVGTRRSPAKADPKPRGKLRPPPAPRGPRALAQLLRAHLPGEQEGLLRTLAERFDNKTFLPSIADVRELLAMLGEDTPLPKDRAGAFRLVLRALSRLPPAQIRDLAASPRFSGPAQLGPLSEAIAARAATLTRQR